MSTQDQAAGEPLLSRGEVAALFRVDPATVSMWARKGKIPSLRTLGGHRRFPQSHIHALLAGAPYTRANPADPR